MTAPDHSLPDRCAACLALEREAGEHVGLYARKLLLRGWAGKLSDVERPFVAAHAPWYQKAAAAGRERAAARAAQASANPQDGAAFPFQRAQSGTTTAQAA